MQINDVAKESTAGRKALSRSYNRLYKLPHTEKEKNTNDYILAILLAWHGNMDIQFIGEESKVLTRHCTKYVTKPEKTQAAHVLAYMASNKTINTKFWIFAMRRLMKKKKETLTVFMKLRNTEQYWGKKHVQSEMQ